MKKSRDGDIGPEGGERGLEWVPLSVREARLARKRRDDLWPYVWMNFVSMILLFAAAVILAYRVGAHSCH
jgi:hypothetical protein